MAAAKEAGLDMAKLEKDFGGDEVRATLEENLKLAESMGMNGTPSYVIGKQIVIGAVGLENLQGKDRHRPLRQGDLLIDAINDPTILTKAGSQAGLFVCALRGRNSSSRIHQTNLAEPEILRNIAHLLRCRRGQCIHVRRDSMTNRFLISVAAAALIAGTGLANAQGMNRRAAVAPPAARPCSRAAAPSERGAPSAAPTNRDSARPAA